MAKPKMTEVFTTATKNKVMDIPIYKLRISVTPDDKWGLEYIRRWGDSIMTSPQFMYLHGMGSYCLERSKAMGIPENYTAGPLMQVLKSIMEQGQKEPILIYRDFRINTGHKRAACMLFLGRDFIKAEYVDDNYKL